MLVTFSVMQRDYTRTTQANWYHRGAIDAPPRSTGTTGVLYTHHPGQLVPQGYYTCTTQVNWYHRGNIHDHTGQLVPQEYYTRTTQVNWYHRGNIHAPPRSTGTTGVLYTHHPGQRVPQNRACGTRCPGWCVYSTSVLSPHSLTSTCATLPPHPPT